MTGVSDVASTPGWYGKLPTVGDFASRRLEADFIEPWDVWLGEGLQAQRNALGEGWLDAYLHSPPWQFIAFDGALPSLGRSLVVAGVLMPSVDRVGRYFPLTLAASLPERPTSGRHIDALLGWLSELETLAVGALHNDWTIEELEDALSAIVSPSRALGDCDARFALGRTAFARALSSSGNMVELPEGASRGDVVGLLCDASTGAASPTFGARDLGGTVVWMGSSQGTPRWLVSRGLPPSDAFVTLFGGGGAQPSGAPPAALAPTMPAAPTAFWSDAPQGASAAAALLPETAAFSLPGSLPAAEVLPVAAHIPDDDYLLGLFVSPVDPSTLQADAAPTDLRELLAAGAASTQATGVNPEDAPPLPAARKDDDILAMFADTPAAPVDESDLETRRGSPDILDLFGPAAVKPKPSGER